LLGELQRGTGCRFPSAPDLHINVDAGSTAKSGIVVSRKVKLEEGTRPPRSHYTVRSSPFLRSVDGGTELLSVGFVLYAPLLLCPSFLAVRADIRLIPGDLTFNHFPHVPLKRLFSLEASVSINSLEF
jgi:hypothetical protein